MPLACPLGMSPPGTCDMPNGRSLECGKGHAPAFFDAMDCTRTSVPTQPLGCCNAHDADDSRGDGDQKIVGVKAAEMEQSARWRTDACHHQHEAELY
jgi:hypothetical protein